MEKLLSDCSKFVKIYFNPKRGNKPAVMYGLCKVIKVQLITITYLHFAQFCFAKL